MPKKCIINRDIFVNDAKEVYGDKYDYSLIESVTSKTENVEIICNEHGVFKSNYNRFIKEKTGCPKCRSTKRWTQDVVIDKIHEIHGDKYDTSKLIFKNTKTKFILTCSEHGDFTIDMNHILRMQGCPKCRYVKSSKSNTRSIEEVINEANKTHNNKYDYSLLTEYKNDRTKYKIICPEHGVFEQTMNNHINGKQGCPECGKLKYAESNRIKFEDFVIRANQVHNNKYTYSKETFVNGVSKTHIKCPEHGWFWQLASNHLYGHGCKKCGYISNGEKSRLTQEDFIKKANKIHGDRYDYSSVNYINNITKVDITCKKHGIYRQLPYNHLTGNGCPKCVPLYSKKEDEIIKFLQEELNVKCIHNERTVLDGKEIDIYCPDYKIGIEYDGLYWHSEINKDKNYHLNKTTKCEEKGVKLIHIFEDEWIYKQDIIKSMLRNLFQNTINKIYARKCIIKEVTPSDATKFLNENHLQGRCPSKVKIGLYYNNELVSIMTFGKSRHFIGNGIPEWELIRFCNKLNTTVIGAASKLLKYFIKNYCPKEIVTYADKRFSTGNLYFKLGFEQYNISRPNYYYIIDGKRHYRFNFRKSILKRKYGCPDNVSEHEFCLSKKWYRIYDCGNLCFKMLI